MSKKTKKISLPRAELKPVKMEGDVIQYSFDAPDVLLNIIITWQCRVFDVHFGLGSFDDQSDFTVQHALDSGAAQK